MMYNIRSDTIRCQRPDFLTEGNSNVCNLTIYEIIPK